jgi:hypothetical protein
MALLNTHPDYLVNPNNLRIYTEFLKAMQNKSGYWQALPHEVSSWWKTRAGKSLEAGRKNNRIGNIFLKEEIINVN